MLHSINNSHWKKGCIKPHHLQLLDLICKAVNCFTCWHKSNERNLFQLISDCIIGSICFNTFSKPHLSLDVQKITQAVFFQQNFLNDFWCLMGMVLYIFLDLKCPTSPDMRPSICPIWVTTSFRINCWLIFADLQKSSPYPIGKASTDGGYSPTSPSKNAEITGQKFPQRQDEWINQPSPIRPSQVRCTISPLDRVAFLPPSLLVARFNSEKLEQLNSLKS